MVYTLFIFLPVAVCIFWLVVHTLMASRTETYPEFICLCASVGVYLFSDACHATQPSGSPLDTSSLIASLFFGPCIIPLIIMYLRKLMHRRRRHQFALLWIIIPAVLFTGGILLYILNVDERVNQAFNLIVGPIFHTVLACELVVLMVFILSTLRYRRILPGSLISFFKGKPISLARLQIYTIIGPLAVMVLRIIIKDNLYTTHSWVAIASAALIMVFLYIFGLNALFGIRSKVSWHDFHYVIRYNYNSENKAEVVERIMEELLDEAEEEALRRMEVGRKKRGDAPACRTHIQSRIHIMGRRQPNIPFPKPDDGQTIIPAPQADSGRSGGGTAFEQDIYLQDGKQYL